jgi:ATP sulfurylase
MDEFNVERMIVLRENFYCQKCGDWVYCPEMNVKCKNDQGKEVECVAEGCLKQNEKGEFLECPSCGSRYFLL